MIHKEITEIIALVKNNNIIRNVTVLIAFISLIIGLFFSFLAAFVIFANYLSGFVVCWFFIKYQQEATFCLHHLASFYRLHLLSPEKLSVICSICKTNSCTRHQAYYLTPWKHLRISAELNEALEHFYNTILDRFVSSWYNSFTIDVTFVSELKVSLRFASASFINQFLLLDTSRIIAKKIIPCAIKHVDDYLCMQQIANLKNVHVNDVAVEYYGKRLHIAVTNRNNEMNYLRHLASCMLPKVLSRKCLKSRNYFVLIREIVTAWVLLPLMDVLANPNMINSLVILIANYKSKGIAPLPVDVKSVEFLHNFVNQGVKQSSFASDLKTVLKTTDLLYAFMQYLKQEGPVNILQFCLDIEDFNNKLLIPDMSKKQLENLHAEALNIYKIYFDHKSNDYIGFNNKINDQLQRLLEEGVYNVAKLRTSEPLYKAYDFAFNVLEKDWLPGFFHSNEFYNYLCGPKITSGYTKLSPYGSKNKKSYDPSNQGTVAKISSGLGRIKGVLKPNQPVEGSIFTPDLQMYPDSTAFVEDIFLADCESIFRDLSAWRISIPSVETHQSSSSKSFHVFNINVQRIDTVSESEIRHWIVRRKEQDFYTLNTKLIEFHGENEISGSPLPSRRSNLPLETRKGKYESFLSLLLQKPSLRGSDLLHTFLTTDQDFTLLVSCTVPVVEDLGNIYQSVAFKLRKEKGQHLDSFMNTFLASTGKSKQSKIELAEVGDEMEIVLSEVNDSLVPATFNNPVFKNNFGINYKKKENSSSTSFNPLGITESIFYLMKHIFKIRNSVLRLFAAVCNVGQELVEKIIRLYIDRKLRSSLSQSNLRDLVVLLEETIFEVESKHKKEDIEKRKLKAFSELEQILPYFVQVVLGDDFTRGLKTLLEILQNPLYNKQLVYNLLDIIVSELYPEINSH
ncbi:hypothetical protein RN001_009563 [Aquatica leii]|uniref:Sorting nexin-14-like n=1 Tax=Aquatica leii TaxID=1421715 RepID=A0AAN7PVI1_9COLE|nr:hypothetical protein RN001_009563 [Aquatica leii]